MTWSRRIGTARATPGVSAYDVSVVGGAGVSVRAGPGRVLVDVRETRGLRDIDRHERAPDERALHRAYMLMAGDTRYLGR